MPPHVEEESTSSSPDTMLPADDEVKPKKSADPVLKEPLQSQESALYESVLCFVQAKDFAKSKEEALYPSVLHFVQAKQEHWKTNTLQESEKAQAVTNETAADNGDDEPEKQVDGKNCLEEQNSQQEDEEPDEDGLVVGEVHAESDDAGEPEAANGKAEKVPDIADLVDEPTTNNPPIVIKPAKEELTDEVESWQEVHKSTPAVKNENSIAPNKSTPPIDEPSSTKTPNPRKAFSDMTRLERASLDQLRSAGGVQRNKQIFDKQEPTNNTPPTTTKQEETPTKVKTVANMFGGSGKKKRISTVQQRKLELEEAERKAKEEADPESQLKRSWNNTGRHGAYEKMVTHKKGPRSKKNLADLP